MGAQLGVILTVNNVAVRDGQNRIKARTGVPLGHVTVSDSGGTGTVTHALIAKPDWDTRDASTILTHNEGTWSIAPLLPPVAGITSRYDIQATDSATPTPATATAVLRVETALPAGNILLERTGRVPIQLDTAVWQLLDHARIEHADSSSYRDHSVTIQIWRHGDGRLILYSHEQWTTKRSGETTSARYATFDSGDLDNSNFCSKYMSSTQCTAAQADAAWQTLLSHLPPYIP